MAVLLAAMAVVSELDAVETNAVAAEMRSRIASSFAATFISDMLSVKDVDADETNAVVDAIRSRIANSVIVKFGMALTITVVLSLTNVVSVAMAAIMSVVVGSPAASIVTLNTG